MKTEEQKQAAREAREAATIANVTGPRTGYTPEAMDHPPAPAPALQGLRLSDVQLWALDRFKDHPSNHVFESSKTESYWRDLRRDILDAGAIINPVIALPDGTLLEGHSRIRIARELETEGKPLGKIPVRIVASPITPAEAERRVYLGNLSRFELDDDTRLTLYAKVWPDYFQAKTQANTKGGDTVSPPATKAEIAAATGKSPRQVQRDGQIVRTAAHIAQKKGKSEADRDDIREARKKAASKRKATTKADSDHVKFSLPRNQAELVLRAVQRMRPPNTALVKAIEKAIGK
jgi:hypothetical protein